MTTISFYKYQGTGNDFVMIDNRNKVFPQSDLNLVSQLCHRRFGIGADGVILIERAREADFEMTYYNPDGSQSLCGNGSRCAVMFARFLGIIENQTSFKAIDGMHTARIIDDQVQLLMHDAPDYEKIGEDFLIDTGSPHYIKYVPDTGSIDAVAEGRKIRYAKRFTQKGVNVNFLEVLAKNKLRIKTYERGVEAETWSCGTGCTAAAISWGLKTGANEVCLEAVGGELKVSFTKVGDIFRNIYLTGPANAVYAGEITL